MVVELIRAFGIFAANSGQAFHLAIAGRVVDKNYGARVTDEIKHCHLEEKVHLLGAVSRESLDLLYTQADLFAFTSLSENAGAYPLLDALAYGKPIVCSSLSSMPEVCGDAVVYVDPREPNEVAAALSRIATDPALRARLSKRASAQSRQLPAWQDIATSTTRFLESVLR